MPNLHWIRCYVLLTSSLGDLGLNRCGVLGILHLCLCFGAKCLLVAGDSALSSVAPLTVLTKVLWFMCEKHSLFSPVLSPWRIVDDCGGAFTMGTIGGGIFQAIKGFRNSPVGVNHRLRGSLTAIKTRAPQLGGTNAEVLHLCSRLFLFI